MAREREKEKSSQAPRSLACATKLENKEEIKNVIKIVFKIFSF